MNIILVSGRLAKARTITLGLPQLIVLGTGMLIALVCLAVLLHYAALRFAPALPYLQKWLVVSPPEARDPHESGNLQENLNAMAIRLGQLQAQLLRLDSLGDRLARLAGFKPQDLMFDQMPARGGAVSTLPAEDISLGDFRRQIELLGRQLEERGDRLGVLESLFTLDSAKKKLVPTMIPVQEGWHSSNYGWRIDPFTGQRAFHEGMDFMAEAGTPIRAAAAGVVVFAGFHPQYGNMIEIDHGNDLITRYAHASKLDVRVGDVVLMGAKIAEVGRSGRATGTHLHFEVRERGAPRDPARFLRLPG
jgi:murein DD-endopeptidase MepM/ murein hydrolase activator NlpD